MKKLLLLSSVALLLIIIWAFSRGQWQLVTEESGLSRRAISQPWLASELLLQQHDRSLSELSEIAQLKPILASGQPSDLVLVINENILRFNPELADELLEWTEAGGHLVYQLSADNRRQVASNSLTQGFELDIDLSAAYVQQYWHIIVRNNFVEAKANFKNGLLDLAVMPDSRIERCAGSVMTVQENDDEPSDAFVACQFVSGSGKVTFTSQLLFMQNSLLDKADNALFLLTLLADARQLVVIKDPGTLLWFQRLWLWNWPLWIIMLLTLGLLFWRLAQRLSPPVRPLSTRDNLFEQHLHASGDFLMQQMPAQWLKQQLMQDVLWLSERRYPGFSRLPETEQQQLIASWCNMSLQQLNQFFNQPWPARSVAIAEYIGFWQTIRKAI
ncbi:DUF4350 domain-containing protein [Arsukibacterium sp.]|uniref:DUF4350 domain-containing protein n=1 Tax=Arsukibacterium sp. TaxID=1977258 RepID=UPI001BD239B8|nr:DUF4350 domain-containing protein [Arsukibacterium sp.]